jgi:hypothetical protein
MARRRTTRRGSPALWAFLAIALVVAGLWIAATDADAGRADPGVVPVELGEAIRALPSAVPYDAADYDRNEFGGGWLDTDRNGCDSRNDVLARDLHDVVFKAGTQDCVVLRGVLDDPYTGQRIDFQRGDKTSEEVQIDHVVPLSWAWAAGADGWDQALREEFANDPDNLLAVDGPTNSAKSDSGPSEWVPPSLDYDCAYATRFTAVLTEYRLPVGDADREALLELAASCPA